MIAIKRASATAILFGMALVSFSGCQPEAQAPPPEPPPVSVRHPEARQLADTEEFNGWLAPDETVEVRSRVRGHILKVNFVDGEFVEKGKVLFVLDPREFDAAIGRAADRITIFKAQLLAAEKDLDRVKYLVERNAAPQQEMDKVEADVKSLVAQVSAAENDLTRAKLDKEYSEIKAEVSGRISRAQLTVGNLVNAGGSDPLLTTIVAIDTLRLYFNVDERSLQAYARNLGLQGRNLTDLLAQLRDQKTIVKFAQDGEKLFAHEGDLAFGDNRIDPSTGTLQVYATVANKDRQFLPGARVRVRLVIGKAYDALLVPESAILADQDKRYVLVIDAEKVVRRRNVTLGALTDDSMRAVTPADKLDPQENPSQWLVIVDNLQRARLNYPVNPQTATATASEAGAAPPTTTTAPAATAPTSAR